MTRQFCTHCLTELTSTDIKAGHCTQCGWQTAQDALREAAYARWVHRHLSHPWTPVGAVEAVLEAMQAPARLALKERSNHE